MKRPGFEADRFELQLRDIATGKVTPLAATWDRSVDDFAWSRDGRSIYAVAADVGRTRLFKIDVKSGTVTPLSKDGHMDAFHETATLFFILADVGVRIASQEISYLCPLAILELHSCHEASLSFLLKC